MKNSIVYIAIFAFAFAGVSGGIYYMNSRYENIFKLDFRPVGAQPEKKTEEKKGKDKGKTEKKTEEKPKITADSSGMGSIPESLSATFIEPGLASLSSKDTVVKNVVDTALKDSIKQLQAKIKELTDKKEIKKEPVKDTKKEVKADTIKDNSADLANVIQKSDSTYKSWLKKTKTLYEAMDSKKAAKIILTYSDNIAKDIIYSMKKKKAADILSQLSPETVNRITRVKQ